MWAALLVAIAACAPTARLTTPKTIRPDLAELFDVRDPPSGPDAVARSEALLADGRRLRTDGRAREAIAVLKQAFALRRDPRVLAEIAEALRGERDLPAALAVGTRALELAELAGRTHAVAEVSVGASVDDAAALAGAFAPDGTWVTGDSQGLVKIWDPITGMLLRVVRSRHRIAELAMSPDGTRIVVRRLAPPGAWERVLIDARTGADIRVLDDEHGPFRFLPDNRLLLWTMRDGLRELDLPSGRTLVTYETADADHDALWISATGDTFLSSTRYSGELIAWRRGSAAQRRVKADAGWAGVLALTPDGRRAVLGGRGRDVRIVDVETGDVVMRLAVQARSGAVSRDGKLLALATEHAVELWDLAAQRVTTVAATGAAVFGPGGGPAGILAIRPAEQHVGWRRHGVPVATFWDPAGKQLARAIDASGWAALAFRGDGAELATTTGGRLRIWDLLATGSPLELGDRERARSASYDNGRLVALVGNSITTWDVRHQRRSVVTAPDQALWAGLLPGGVFAVGDGAPTVFALDPATGHIREQVRAFEADRDPAFVVAPGGGVLFANRNEALAWQPGTRDLATFARLDAHASALAVSADGKRVAIGDDAGRISVWDAGTRMPGRVIDTGGAPITAIAYGSAGGVIAASSWRDNDIALWDPATGARFGVLRGQTAPATAIELAPGGRVVAAASLDGAIRLWSVATGELLATARATPTGAWIVATPDGRVDGVLADATPLAWRIGDLVLPAIAGWERHHVGGLLAQTLAAAPAATVPGPGLAGARPSPDAPPARCLPHDAHTAGYVAVRDATISFCMAGSPATCWQLELDAGVDEKIEPTATAVPAAFVVDATAQPAAPARAAGELVARWDTPKSAAIVETSTQRVVRTIDLSEDPAVQAGYSPALHVLGQTLLVTGVVCAGPCAENNLYDIRTGRRIGEVPVYDPTGPTLLHARGDLWWFESEPDVPEESGELRFNYVLINVRTGKIARTFSTERAGHLTSQGVVLLPATAGEPVRILRDDGGERRRIAMPRCP